VSGLLESSASNLLLFATGIILHLQLVRYHWQAVTWILDIL